VVDSGSLASEGMSALLRHRVDAASDMPAAHITEREHQLGGTDRHETHGSGAAAMSARQRRP
jgi:hypothetical protein